MVRRRRRRRRGHKGKRCTTCKTRRRRRRPGWVRGWKGNVHHWCASIVALLREKSTGYLGEGVDVNVVGSRSWLRVGLLKQHSVRVKRSRKATIPGLEIGNLENS